MSISFVDGRGILIKRDEAAMLLQTEWLRFVMNSFIQELIIGLPLMATLIPPAYQVAG